MIRTNELPKQPAPAPVPSDIKALLRELENVFQKAKESPRKATSDEPRSCFGGK